MHTRTLFLVLIIFTLTGCESGIESTEADDSTEDGYHPDGYLIYTGPPFEFNVTQTGDETHFDWSVEVPTGGWELEYFGAMYDEIDNYYVVYLHLKPPDPDEMVTQALVTHKGEHDDKDVDFTEAVLAVMYFDNALPDDEALDYAKAAEWP